MSLHSGEQQNPIMNRLLDNSFVSMYELQNTNEIRRDTVAFARERRNSFSIIESRVAN